MGPSRLNCLLKCWKAQIPSFGTLDAPTGCVSEASRGHLSNPAWLPNKVHCVGLQGFVQHPGGRRPNSLSKTGLL